MPEVITLLNPGTGAEFDYRGRWLRNSPATDQDVRMGRARFRGDKVYLPLPPGVQAQVDKGNLIYKTPADQADAHRAALAPDDLAGIAGMPGGVPMPGWDAPHGEWQAFAVSAGMDPDMAAGLTRDQIRARFGAAELARDDAPNLEQLDRDPEARASRRRR